MARRAAFVPIHWSAANSSEARVGAVVSPTVDPISGEPEFKHTPVRVEPFVVDWYGFIVSRRPVADLNVTWWTRVQGAGVTRYEVAGRGVPPDWPTWARALIGATDSNADYLEYCDVAAGSYRAAHLTEDRLEAYVCVARRPDLPERAWLAELFSRDRLGEGDRLSLLAGRAFGKTKNLGALVCSCFGVGRNELVRAIRQGRLTDAHRIGLALKAGTGCGSCLPEIKSLIGATAHEPSPLEGACPPES
jgi:assimilatory nitrate reductase catalytic subunit